MEATKLQVRYTEEFRSQVILPDIYAEIWKVPAELFRCTLFLALFWHGEQRLEGECGWAHWAVWKAEPIELS